MQCFAIQAHPIWEPLLLVQATCHYCFKIPLTPSPGPPGADSAPCSIWVAEARLKVNTATLPCVLGHLKSPGTNTDPIHHSRTPALQASPDASLRHQGPASWLASQARLAGFTTRSTARRGGLSYGELLVRAPVRQPQGLPSQRHRKDTRLSQCWALSETVAFTLLLPTHVLLLIQRRSGQEWGSASINPSPLQRAGKLALLDPVIYSGILNAAIMCVHMQDHFVCLRTWPVITTALPLYLVILPFFGILSMYIIIIAIPVFCGLGFVWYIFPSLSLLTCVFIFKGNLLSCFSPSSWQYLPFNGSVRSIFFLNYYINIVGLTSANLPVVFYIVS